MGTQWQAEQLRKQIESLAPSKPYEPAPVMEKVRVFLGLVLVFGAVMVAWNVVPKWLGGVWDAKQSADAQQAQKDAVRAEQDKILSVRCVGSELTSPACIEWARSR
jgi:hypothetical protein